MEVFHAPVSLYILESREPFRQGKVGLLCILRYKSFVGGRQLLQLTQAGFEGSFGFAHSGYILTRGLIIRLRHKVELQVLVTAATIVVTVQINRLIPVLHRLEPDFDRRLLCIFVSVVCHAETSSCYHTANIVCFLETRNKNG